MPAFDTPEPILATISLGAGEVRINASDRTDTVVEVRPSDESDATDVRVAEQTRIEYSNGHLLVKAPRNRARSLFARGGSIEVTVDLPTDSRIDADATADVRGTGRLGDVTLKSASGDIRLDQTGRLRLTAANGEIAVSRAVGHAAITTANGEIRVGEIDGRAVIQTVNGGISLGEVTGDLRLNTAYGDITVDRVSASVNAKTASGSIRIAEVTRGSVVLETAHGELEVGVRQGTVAWLDLSALYGNVRNSLRAAGGPEPSDETVEVRARTSYGDIVIHRS